MVDVLNSLFCICIQQFLAGSSGDAATGRVKHCTVPENPTHGHDAIAIRTEKATK